METLKDFNVYNDIAKRTKGELYLGVSGPVRTGKSTFIKRFMEICVIPRIENEYDKKMAVDELPHSASGKTIMTTEPKFVPKDGVEVSFGEAKTKIRLIDCVGFMVEGATGHMENGEERKVKTPWIDEPVDFSFAAESGTRKVIEEYSNIEIIVTTDGSFNELQRESYVAAEEKAVYECLKSKKPTIIILNSTSPELDETIDLAFRMQKKYQVPVVPCDCKNMNREDVEGIMETILSNFPITKIEFNIPKWVEFLSNDHWLKKDLIAKIKDFLSNVRYMNDVSSDAFPSDTEYIEQFIIQGKGIDNGVVRIEIAFKNQYYFETLSELVGTTITGEYDLISTLQELAAKKNEFEKISVACNQVKQGGYGIVTPTKEELFIEKPELIKQGNRYGIKIKALCPSIHMIQADIETELAPIVGSEQQANDLIAYISEQARNNPDGILETNILGKTIGELVEDGMNKKVENLDDESRDKIKDTIGKVVNDNNGSLVCIIV